VEAIVRAERVCDTVWHCYKKPTLKRRGGGAQSAPFLQLRPYTAPLCPPPPPFAFASGHAYEEARIHKMEFDVRVPNLNCYFAYDTPEAPEGLVSRPFIET